MAFANFKSYIASTADIEMISTTNSLQVAYMLGTDTSAALNCTDGAACTGSAVFPGAPFTKNFNADYVASSAFPGVRAAKKIGYYVSFGSMNCGKTGPSSTAFQIYVSHCDSRLTTSGGSSMHRMYRWTETCGGTVDRRFFNGYPATGFSIGGTC